MECGYIDGADSQRRLLSLGPSGSASIGDQPSVYSLEPGFDQGLPGHFLRYAHAMTIMLTSNDRLASDNITIVTYRRRIVTIL